MRADSTACRITATMPGRLERVVGAEAARQVEDLLHRVGPAGEHVGRALPARELEPLRREVDGDDPLGALQPAAGDRAEADEAGAEDDAGRARPAPSPCSSPRRARSRGRRRRRRRRSSGASGVIFASAISGITVYSAKVEVPMKCRIGSPSRESRVVPSGR